MRNYLFFIGIIMVIAVLCSGCTSQNPGTATPVPTVLVTPSPLSTQVPAGSQPETLLKDMAALDQAYIPVLALTTQNDPVGSRKSMDTLITTWSAFKGTYYTAMPQDPGWKPDLDTVNKTIYSANARITEGNLSAAHTELEQFRLTMLDLRTRNKIDFFIDKMTRFHEPMEAIVLAALDKTPDKVDVATIQRVYPDAVVKWDAVKTGTIDATLFGFTPVQEQKTRTLIANQTLALDTLGTALKSGNNTAIGKAAVGIKGPFSILFSSFGKFPA
jgi:hypothetical protein